jgi:hypothetical protein
VNIYETNQKFKNIINHIVKTEKEDEILKIVDETRQKNTVFVN